MKQKLVFFLMASVLIFNQLSVVFAAPTIEAGSAILMDANTGLILYERNAHDIKYPASITKLMTALLFLEYLDGDFNQRVEMSYNAIFSTPPGSSIIAMNDGETLSARDALYAIMLTSANEVSNAIAEHVAGSLDDFAELMTRRAEELGAEHTHFTNAHGFHDPDHYTTAYDMALIQRELTKFPEFLDIINTPVHFIPPTERQPEERPLLNNHRMVNAHEPLYNPHVIGGKTGFHNQAGHTLTTYAVFDGYGLIAVIMDAARGTTFTDTQTLFDYGETLYEPVNVFSADDFHQTIDIKKLREGALEVIGSADAIVKEDVVLMLPNIIDFDAIETQVVLPDHLEMGVYKGKKIGHIEVIYAGILLANIDIVSGTYFEYPTDIEYPAVYTAAYETYTSVVDSITDQIAEVIGVDISAGLDLGVEAFINVNNVIIGVCSGMIIYHLWIKHKRNQLKKRYLNSASRGRLRSHDRYALGGRKDLRESGRFFRE